MKDSFIEKFPIIKGNKENPYLILFDAYCGQGKSYISKIISKYDNSIIMNNDEVRSWLNNYENNNELLYELQVALTLVFFSQACFFLLGGKKKTKTKQ